MRSLSVTVLLVVTALVSQAQTINFDRGYAMVFPKDGIGVPVRSVQLYGDSVICISPELRVFAKSDISKILVRNEPPPRTGAGIGTVLGVYTSHYLIGRATNQPGAFVSYDQYGDNTSNYIWTTLLGIAVGGGLGYLLDNSPRHGSLHPYIFAGNTELINEQWRLFTEAAEGAGAKPKLHLSISGGSVSTSTTDGYRKMLENEGFTNFNPDYYYSTSSGFSSENYVEKSTNFNLLRKASVEYAITDNIWAGLATAWISEPALFARKGDPNQSAQEVYEFLQKIDGKGYYATGGYHYYLTRKRDLEVNATLGVGMSVMNHQIKGWYRRNSSDPQPEEDIITNENKYFSFMTSAGISYSIYNSMSIGLTANYFHGGSATIEDMFIIDLPSMEVTYSSIDVGFAIGVHF